MAPRSFRQAAAALALPLLAKAQLPAGTLTPEVHPQLSTWKCTTAGGCAQQNTTVVLDFNYRWMHTATGYDSCTTSSGVNSTLCPDEATCAKNCVVEGTNYTSSGVSTSGDVLTMSQYVNNAGTYQNASPRLYLLGPDGNYVSLKLLNQELSFDVDLSATPCGENAALYLAQMDMTGGRSQYNTAAANYGAGYCDAQCPVQTWRNGTLNTNSAGYCCNEMDILEANSAANAFTPHPCTSAGCDKNGCGFNPYAAGNHTYWGPGGYIDTSKVFTVVTRFETTDGTATGSLSKIVRYYIQNGKTLASSSGTTTGDVISADACSSASGFGGLDQMGKSLAEGMVLTFAIWNDNSGNMTWLDSGSNGPCTAAESGPSVIVQKDPTTHVVFSKIKWGDIGSTANVAGAPSGGSAPSSSAKPTTVAPTSKPATSVAPTSAKTSAQPTHTAVMGAGAAHWAQCGGIGYAGQTTCLAPYTCQKQNDYYSQCL